MRRKSNGDQKQAHPTLTPGPPPPPPPTGRLLRGKNKDHGAHPHDTSGVPCGGFLHGCACAAGRSGNHPGHATVGSFPAARVAVFSSFFPFFSVSLPIRFYDACSSTPPAVLPTPPPRAAHNRATLSVRTRRREHRASARGVPHPPPTTAPARSDAPAAGRPWGGGDPPRPGRPAPAPSVTASGSRPWRSPARRRGDPPGGGAIDAS